jgi:hypothetical protein
MLQDQRVGLVVALDPLEGGDLLREAERGSNKKVGSYLADLVVGNQHVARDHMIVGVAD